MQSKQKRNTSLDEKHYTSFTIPKVTAVKMKTATNFRVAAILSIIVYIPQASPGKDILGLFTLTNCDEGFEFDCTNALFNEKRLRYHVNLKKYSDSGKLCIKDSQNDHNNVLQILLPLVLSKESVVNIQCRDNSTLQLEPAKGFVMFTYMSFLLTRLATSTIVPFQNVIFIGVTDQPMYPAYYLDNPSCVYSYECSFGEKMHKNEFIKLKNDLDVSYGGLVNLRDSSRDLSERNVMNCNEESAMCLYTRENPGDCYKEIDVVVRNKTSINNTMNLLSQNNISFVILSGEGHLQQLFQQSSGIKLEQSRDKFFVMYQQKSTKVPELPRDPTNFKNFDVLLNFAGTLGINNLFYFISDLSKLLIDDRNVLEGFLEYDKVQRFILSKVNCFLIKMLYRKYTCNSPITYEIWVRIPRSLRKSYITLLSNNKEAVESLLMLMKQRFYISNVDYHRLMQQQIFNPTLALEAKPYCYLQKPNCREGEELFHSFFKEPHWKRCYGWNCQRCLAGYYKENYGNIDNCIPCLYPLVTNDQHSACYDPYKMFTPQLNDFGNVAIVGMSITMSLLVSITIFVFCKHRNTPIVLSANRTMTMLQLFMHMMLSILPPVLFFAKHSKSICILQQTIVGLGFAVTISVNICKTQKLFLIINTNILMSKSKILLTKLSEWIIIFSVSCINGLFQFLTLLNKDITVHIKYFDDSLEKEAYCSNHLGIYLQITFATILVFCNGVQGFRGRNLPSQFKETNHVIYSSFISLIVFFASTAVYFTAKRESAKEFVIMVTLTVLNFIHFILLYAYKVYLIIFKPEMNTKTAFNKKRQKKFENMTLTTTSAA